MAQIAVEHELPVDADDGAGQAAGGEHQRRFERAGSAAGDAGFTPEQPQARERRRVAARRSRRARRPSRRPRRSAAASRSPRAGRGLRRRARRSAPRALAASDTSRPLAGPSARSDRRARRGGVCAGAQRDRRARVGARARPCARVVGAADEDHAGRPREVRRRRRDPVANASPVGVGSVERVADAGVVFCGDLLRDGDPAAFGRGARPRCAALPATIWLRRSPAARAPGGRAITHTRRAAERRGSRPGTRARSRPPAPARSRPRSRRGRTCRPPGCRPGS